MKKLHIFLVITLAFISSCKENYRKDLSQKETKTIQNLNNQKVSIDSINAFIKRKMKEMDIPGVSYAIINNGQLVFHNTLGYSNLETKIPVNSETIFEGASTSKPVFASLVMLLVEDKKLDLDTPLYTYLDENTRNNYNHDLRYQKITARIVLSHTTGFPNWRGSGDLTISFEPGTDFSYSGEGYQFLVKTIESILLTDYKGLENYFQQRIATPLGMIHTKFVQDDYNRNHKAFPHFRGIKKEKNNWIAKEFNAASALHTESREFSKWLIAIMENSLLSKSSTEIMLMDQIEASKTPSLLSDAGAMAWTLGFAKYKNSGHIIYGHEGNNDGFSCLFLFDKDKKWAMIQFNNANEAYDFGYDLFGYINKDN
ncbi:serine hydrolase domain-containing protein [Aquimarina mytili]|uniref:Beta-lactamase family protein n=1 Tax=Aquimarina mytili TaxID=874423 RepID=A0A937A1N5_9FLAO|nr:serine hydrolase domain-containing protein [Aquimarina mytili]MBL0685231.1 beta-lactamase family protein [Aquimarina mytili]